MSSSPVTIPTATYTDEGRPILFYAKATDDFCWNREPDDLDIRNGDIIAVTHAPEDGWWKGELVDATGWRRTTQGTFPSHYVDELGAPRQGLQSPLTRLYTDEGWLILFYVKAVSNYTAMLDDEMDFRAGDMIAVTDAPEDGWWSGELLDEARRETGRNIFPSNYVRLF